jgi:glycosyltransferase involved in cell wall biosynthesis
LSAERILVVVDGLPLGGTERQVVSLLRGLRRHGRFTAALAVLDAGGSLDCAAAAAATETVAVRRRARYDATVASRLWSYARRTGVRAIHAVGWMSGAAGLAAARAANIPIVNGSIRSAPPSLGWRDRVSRWCAAHSDAIVANSRVGLAAYGLADHPRSQIIVNGINVESLRSIDTTPRARPTICMVANFNGWKDHETVIRAVPAIRTEIPDVEVVLVGHDRGTLTAVRMLIRELGVEPSVTIVEDCSEPERFIAGSRVAVLASHVEGFSTAMLEYMMLGKPVVASDTCGDVAVFVQQASAGFIYRHRSVDELAQAVLTLLRDPVLADKMAEVGRRQAAEFTVDRMVGAYESLYARVVGQ